MATTVKKILKIIKSCKTQSQIDDCRIVVQNYIKVVNNKGIYNIEDLKKRLEEEILQKQEAIMLVNIFSNNI